MLNTLIIRTNWFLVRLFQTLNNRKRKQILKNWCNFGQNEIIQA